MSENEFLKQKEAAIKVMKEMNSRTENKNSSTFSRQKQIPQKSQEKSFDYGFNLPFSDMLKNGDTALILGLLLILFSENADKKLLFALIYILM